MTFKVTQLVTSVALPANFNERIHLILNKLTLSKPYISLQAQIKPSMWFALNTECKNGASSFILSLSKLCKMLSDFLNHDLSNLVILLSFLFFRLNLT